MANSYTSPNMLLIIPVPSLDPGPDWASNLNVSLTIIDAHTHAPGSGVQITPSAININADLPFGNTNNATQLRSVRFKAQGSPISASGSDLGCLYESGVDLYYNDGSGNQVRITSGGSVAGSSGTITGLPSGTASAAYVSGSGSFVFQQATSTGANMDVASIAIRYPGSYPTPSGNYIQLQAPSSLATGYSFILPATTPAANGAMLTSSTAGVVSYTNVDNLTLQISSGAISVKTNGVTTLAKNATASSLGVVTQMASSGNTLAILRGAVSSSGSVQLGEGWSVGHTGTGDYTITFTTNFNSTPIVIATAEYTAASSFVANIKQSSLSTSQFEVFITNSNTGTLTDAGFHFLVIGERP